MIEIWLLVESQATFSIGHRTAVAEAEATCWSWPTGSERKIAAGHVDSVCLETAVLAMAEINLDALCSRHCSP